MNQFGARACTRTTVSSNEPAKANIFYKENPTKVYAYFHMCADDFFVVSSFLCVAVVALWRPPPLPCVGRAEHFVPPPCASETTNKKMRSTADLMNYARLGDTRQRACALASEQFRLAGCDGVALTTVQRPKHEVNKKKTNNCLRCYGQMSQRLRQAENSFRERRKTSVLINSL